MNCPQCTTHTTNPLSALYAMKCLKCCARLVSNSRPSRAMQERQLAVIARSGRFTQEQIVEAMNDSNKQKAGA